MTKASQSSHFISATQVLNIEKFDQGEKSHVVQDQVVTEEPLEIWIKQFAGRNQSETIHLSTTMRTPGNDIALVKGWLHSLNILSAEDISEIKYTGTETLKKQQSNRILVTLKPGIIRTWNKVQHNEFTHSSCGICGQQSVEWLLEDLPPINPEFLFTASAQSVQALPEALTAKQSIFLDTGGCHGVGLFNRSLTILDYQEDVGRHNAMDKLIGNNLDKLPGAYGVVLSGRVSFEMAQKAARAGLNMIVAVGAPTSLAISLCQEFDIALAGFVKPRTFNVYVGAERFIGANGTQEVR